MSSWIKCLFVWHLIDFYHFLCVSSIFFLVVFSPWTFSVVPGTLCLSWFSWYGSSNCLLSLTCWFLDSSLGSLSHCWLAWAAIGLWSWTCSIDWFRSACLFLIWYTGLRDLQGGLFFRRLKYLKSQVWISRLRNLLDRFSWSYLKRKS